MGQHLVTLGIVALFVFGLVVPAFVLAYNGAHKASVAVGGVRLTRDETKGRELFAKRVRGVPHAGCGQVGGAHRSEPRHPRGR